MSGYAPLPLLSVGGVGYIHLVRLVLVMPRDMKEREHVAHPPQHRTHTHAEIAYLH